MQHKIFAKCDTKSLASLNRGGYYDYHGKQFSGPELRGQVMKFLKGKGIELVKLAAQAGVKIDECQFAFIPEHVARMCSAQIQLWAATANTCETEEYLNEFTPAGDLQELSQLATFVTQPAEWLIMARHWVTIAEMQNGCILDMAELDDTLWCEALRQEFGDDTGMMAGHGFNLATMLKHAPNEFLTVCQAVAAKYTMRTAERLFDDAIGEYLEGGRYEY